ncbi:hypothetical protein QBC40DRAFT_284386 [Triangularia verruculosa]|uniref:Uncharacterized protein n=1 Tax=Triangularia verruculosa TaxID=2587418 RepID=A0AAN6XCK5_9PEZI|nr:hypothetical protein QBC40DRAFT_284386 [Triangularia verruculosa]
MAEVIQIISKTDFTAQSLTPAPSPSTNLTAPSSVRIQTRLISLTTNTFTYAKLGGNPLLAWWNVWPLPSTVSPETHCRISAWGYSEVVESTIASLPVGSRLFGYQPIGTRAEELQLKESNVAGQYDVVLSDDGLRVGLNAIYNRYHIFGDEDRQSRGLRALFYALWQTGWMLNQHVFAWEGGFKPSHPFGDAGGDGWDAEKADIKGAVIILLAPSGKTGLSFAHELRKGRPEDEQPEKVIAVGSEKSKVFSKSTGLFDEVLLYEQVDEIERLAKKGQKIVLVNFGARGQAADTWAVRLEEKFGDNVIVLLVGGDPSSSRPPALYGKAMDPTSNIYQVHAGLVRETAVANLGSPEAYYKAQETAWERFSREGAVPAIGIRWGNGLEEYKASWDALVDGQYGPETGLVFEL